jgi:hypothetical protein
MALDLGLVDPANRAAVLVNLVADLEKRKYAMTVGEVGLPYLLRALADAGRSDVVFALNNQTESPGYGYQLKMGATALPETWNDNRDNSQIQFMLCVPPRKNRERMETGRPASDDACHYPAKFDGNYLCPDEKRQIHH